MRRYIFSAGFLALLVCGTLLASGEFASGGTQASPMPFSLFLPGATTPDPGPIVVGPVPAGRRLVIRDVAVGLNFSGSLAHLAFLADGEPVGFVWVSTSSLSRMTSLASGIVINGPAELSIQRLDIPSGSPLPATDLTIAGSIE